MFNKERYLTRGISNEIPLEIQILLWSMIDKLNVKKDYVQVFEIEHRQEVPKYKSDIVVKNVGISSKVKIFVIDDGEYSTMMLSSEY